MEEETFYFISLTGFNARPEIRTTSLRNLQISKKCRGILGHFTIPMKYYFSIEGKTKDSSIYTFNGSRTSVGDKIHILHFNIEM